MPLIQLIQMLKINSWMQYKVPQIKHRVLQYKIRFRVPQFKTQIRVLQIQNLAPVHAGQIPAQGPCSLNSSSWSCSSWSKYTSPATTTTSSSTTGPYWYCSAHSPDNLSKLDRKENLNPQVSPKRMQNPIFLVLEIGWKHITSQKEIRLDTFV